MLERVNLVQEVVESWRQTLSLVSREMEAFWWVRLWVVRPPSSGVRMVSALSLRESVAVLFGVVDERESVLRGDGMTRTVFGMAMNGG